MRSKAINGVIWSALESWGNRVISISVFFLLARLLGPEAFGLAATASLVIDFFQIFLDQGFGQSIIQRKEIDDAYLSTAFWINIAFSLILFFAVSLLAGQIASILNEPKLKNIVRYASIAFFLGGLSNVQEAILTREMAFKVLSARSLAASIVSGGIGILAALLGMGVWSLVIKQLVFSFVRTIAVWGMTTWRPNLEFSYPYVKELYAFGSNILGFKVLNFIYRRSSDILISYFLGSTALGFYSVAYRLVIVISDLFIGITQKVALPTFARLQEESSRLKKAFFKVTELTSMVCFPIFSALAILAPELIVIIFGEKWKPSIHLMQILALVGILQSIMSFNLSVILALGKAEWLLRLKLLESTVAMLAFVIGLQWGLTGVTIGFVLTSYMLAPISISLIGSKLEFTFMNYIKRYKETAASTAIFIATAIAARTGLNYLFWNINPFFVVFFSASIASAFYAISLLIMKPEIKSNVYSILKSKLN